MNLEITNNEEKNEWPKLMVNYDDCKTSILLFFKPKIGVVIKSDNPFLHVGRYSEEWVMNNFKPFTGKITLWN